jgi:hypothetical protein
MRLFSLAKEKFDFSNNLMGYYTPFRCKKNGINFDVIGNVYA